MLRTEPLVLDQSFNDILQELEYTNRSFFITGKAGTGKSTLLQLFRQTTKKQVVVLAPTGVAALHVKGQTIHSFFAFPPNMMDVRNIKKRTKNRIYQRMEIMVIDEISMVRADLIDHIDLFLRLNRDSPEAFGGVRVIFFGDLFQLPPVVSSPFEKAYFSEVYESPYFFSAKLFRENGFFLQCIELEKIYRQEERSFIRLLNQIRLNDMDYEDLEYLNTRYTENLPSSEYTVTLSARNAQVDLMNRLELTRISSPEFTYRCTVLGQFDPRLFPTEAILKLKVGAQIMLVRNDLQKRFVNGTIGKVETLDENQIGISFIDPSGEKQFLEIEPTDWEVVKYRLPEGSKGPIETEVVGLFRQFPVKLAWAVTIHKSQGKTYDRVIIDLGQGAFEHGQTYVALSRCRTFGGIHLKQPIRQRDILVDPRVTEFYHSVVRNG
ncbi:MAG: DEAD/DEAH box helicase [Saprospiraceae bacterium]